MHLHWRFGSLRLRSPQIAIDPIASDHNLELVSKDVTPPKPGRLADADRCHRDQYKQGALEQGKKTLHDGECLLW